MIRIKGLTRSFRKAGHETHVLKGIDLHIERAEFVAIIGRSGAGKSTLMYQMSLLDQPTSGEVVLDGHDTHFMSEEEKTAFRLHMLGYVFQDYALLPDLTALENVALPLLMQGLPQKDAYVKAKDALSRMGLLERLSNTPGNLSGGEQQRVSIARAIAHTPKILFADEPTANLDNESSRTVMRIFEDLHAGGQTIVMVTHEEEYAELAERIVKLDDGRIIQEIRDPSPHRHGMAAKAAGQI